jgi:hypothetical protein
VGGHQNLTLAFSSLFLRKGQCLETLETRIRPTPASKADFQMQGAARGAWQGEGRVVWTDYAYALVYECFRPLADGACERGAGNMVVYGRSRDPLPDAIVEKMLEAAGDCYTKDDFEMIPHMSKGFLSWSPT